MSATTPLLAMRGIQKGFPGVQALREVSLELRQGEVLALMGENGAGKSTLMKVLGGIHAPDAGAIEIDGQAVAVPSPRAARALGIRLIHQELMLCPNLDIAGNIFLGEETPGGSALACLPRRTMAREAERWLERVGLKLSPRTLVKTLSPGPMQMVEIAKALAGRARIIVMDEPTSSLTLQEADRLFEIVGQLRREGIAVIYISHRIEEIFRVSDRISVLRDGRNAGELETRGASHDAVVSLMVGRQIKSWFPPKRSRTGDPVLRAEGILVPGASRRVTFEALRGEILGFAGLVGSGRTELMRALFGVEPALSGRIFVEGREVAIRTPRHAINEGIYFAPEDRKLQGLVLSMAVDQNITLPDVRNYHRLKLLRPQFERRVAEAQVRELSIKTPSLAQKLVNLSGGNQQKVVLGKWLAMRPRVLILDEPTRGIDVGAKAEIYRQMAGLAEGGMVVLMVSSDMEEVIGMSDRVAVLHERSLGGILTGEAITEENIMNLAVGRSPRAA